MVWTDGGILLSIDITHFFRWCEYTKEGDHSILIVLASLLRARQLFRWETVCFFLFFFVFFCLLKWPQFEKNHLPPEILHLRACWSRWLTRLHSRLVVRSSWVLSLHVRQHFFVEIDHEIFSMVIPFCWFKKGCCQILATECTQVLVRGL